MLKTSRLSLRVIPELSRNLVLRLSSTLSNIKVCCKEDQNIKLPRKSSFMKDKHYIENTIKNSTCRSECEETYENLIMNEV